MKPLVLLIDDDADLLFEYSEFLKEDFDVTTTDKPATVVDLVKSLPRQPDLIVTDLAMSSLSGEDLIDRVRFEGIGSRVVIAAGDVKKQDLLHAIRRGVVDVLEKPFKPQVLKSCVTEALESQPARIIPKVVADLIATLKERSDVLEDRIFSLENRISEKGLNLFDDNEGFHRFKEQASKDRMLLRKIDDLSEKLDRKNSGLDDG